MRGHRSWREETGLSRCVHVVRMSTTERTRAAAPSIVGRMLTTVAVVLLVLWVLGMVSSTTMGGLIHVLLVIAIVMVLVRLIQGRRLI